MNKTERHEKELAKGSFLKERDSVRSGSLDQSFQEVLSVKGPKLQSETNIDTD